MIERESIPYEAGFLAGEAFLAHRRRGGEERSPLPDFLIGRMRRWLVISC
jgi:hypothetical protein